MKRIIGTRTVSGVTTSSSTFTEECWLEFAPAVVDAFFGGSSLLDHRVLELKTDFEHPAPLPRLDQAVVVCGCFGAENLRKPTGNSFFNELPEYGEISYC